MNTAFGYWWLRSPGNNDNNAADVNNNGYGNNNGNNVNNDNNAVRPDLHNPCLKEYLGKYSPCTICKGILFHFCHDGQKEYLLSGAGGANALSVGE